MALELMGDFFARRLEGYDAHMLRDIEGAEAFYPAAAALLPGTPGCRILDLGCGTGLELEFFFPRNPTARVTGIDLSAEMLEALGRKFRDRGLDLRLGSYLELSLGEAEYDGAISVESLHHSVPAVKLRLYRRLRAALKPGGCFILADYFAGSPAEEAAFFRELEAQKRHDGLADDVVVHFDTPLTPEHELALLREAGFSSAERVGMWEATSLIRASR